MKDVCELINGRAYSKNELLESGKYRVLRVGNFFTSNHWYWSDLELEPSKYCENGDLLYAWSASFGPQIWRDERCIYHYHIWKVRPFEEIATRDFLFYFFEWDKERIRAEQGAGATMVHVSKKSMEARSIPVPPLDEQKRIVAALDQAFAALDRARAKAEESLSDARLVFEAHLRELFSAGEGKAWSTAPLCDLADFRNGINFTKASRGKEVRVLGVKDFQNHFHAPDTGLDRVTIDGNLDPGDCLQSGDIVFVRSNGNPELIGRSLVIERMSERTAHSGFTIRARLRDSEMVPSFLGHFLKSSAVRRQMVDGGTGTNIKSLNQGTLSRILVPLPSRAEQMRIVENLEAVRERTTHIEARYTEQLADIAELRQSLLQAAFSGQLS